MERSDPPLSLAIRAAGGSTVLAGKLGLHRTAVSKWSRVPASRVLEVEALTGIPASELRADIYPPSRFRDPKNGGET